jgi:aspartate/methionine/tyrosine aminotransferase
MIREGAVAAARRLSVGRNLYPQSPALQASLISLTQNIIGSGRLSHYESDADERDKELAAELLDQYLGRPGIRAGDLFFTNGSQEAISIVCAYGARARMGALLPLPLYYAYEQAGARWGLPAAGYYSRDGAVRWGGALPARLLQVLILPNPVTGGLFATPRPRDGAGELEAELTVIDCVYQLGAFGGPADLAEATRKIFRAFPLEKLALIFTVSKDLSLPGLRASVLVSGNRDLMRYAKEDRFERNYSINPLVGQASALYLSLLLLNEARARPREFASRYESVRAAFAGAGVPFPAEAGVESMVGHLDAMVAHGKENLALVRGADSVLALDEEQLPFAGYSVFPRLLRDFGGSTDFLKWANVAATTYGLKLNPAYIFGGTPEVWDDLYPGQYNIRVNISDKTEDLRIALARLAAAERHAAAGSR